MLEGDGAPFHDVTARPADAGGGRGLARADAPEARRAGGRRARARARRPLRARRRRLRPAHVPLRPVRLREDVLARPRARAAPARDRRSASSSSTRTPTSSASGTCATAPTRGSPRATAAWRDAVAVRSSRRAGEPLQLAFPELDSGDPGGRAPARPDRRPRGVRRARRRPGRVEADGRSTSSRASGGEDGRRLVARAKNLGVLDWGLWSRGAEGSILREATDPSVRCLVVDLGSLGHARGAGARGRGRAGAALGAPGRPLAGADRDRRGAQRLPRRSRGPAHRARHRARRPHRRRGPQVRALPARLHPAAAEGARERRSASATTCSSCA